MKLFAKKSDARKVAEHDVSTFYEYPIDFKRMSVGVSEINGVYPSTGYDYDEKVEAIWYVLSGHGKVTTANNSYSLEAGNMLKIPPNTRFKIAGTKLKLLVVSSPPWWPEQHKHEEE